MSDKFKFSASHNTKNMVIDEAMDSAFLGSVQKIEHPEIAALKKRIAELEQQLKTAKANAFLAGCKYADQPIRGMKSMNDLRVAAEQYALKLEQGEASTSDKRDKDLQIEAIHKILSSRLIYMYDISDAIDLYEAGIRAVLK